MAAPSSFASSGSSRRRDGLRLPGHAQNDPATFLGDLGGPSPVLGFIAAIGFPLPVGVELLLSARVHASVFTPGRASIGTHYRGNFADCEIRPSAIRHTGLHARSALFDLYGDHLLSRGGWAPISAVVGLLGTLDISAPAVRTAVSRVVREGWLEPVERDVRGYAATAQARARLEEAHSRIYRTQALEWDGHWHVVAVERPPDRNARARLAQSWATSATAPWPRTPGRAARAASLPAVLRAGVHHHAFRAQHQGQERSLVGRVWDLESLPRHTSALPTRPVVSARPPTRARPSPRARRSSTRGACSSSAIPVCPTRCCRRGPDARPPRFDRQAAGSCRRPVPGSTPG